MAVKKTAQYKLKGHLSKKDLDFKLGISSPKVK